MLTTRTSLITDHDTHWRPPPPPLQAVYAEAIVRGHHDADEMMEEAAASQEIYLRSQGLSQGTARERGLGRDRRNGDRGDGDRQMDEDRNDRRGLRSSNASGNTPPYHTIHT